MENVEVDPEDAMGCLPSASESTFWHRHQSISIIVEPKPTRCNEKCRVRIEAGKPKQSKSESILNKQRVEEDTHLKNPQPGIPIRSAGMICCQGLTESQNSHKVTSLDRQL